MFRIKFLKAYVKRCQQELGKAYEHSDNREARLPPVLMIGAEVLLWKQFAQASGKVILIKPALQV